METDKRFDEASWGEAAMTHVWCADIFGNMAAFASYECPASTSEERQTLLRLAPRNRLGYTLSAENFPPRITSMDTPPRQLTDYAFISARIPMVSPKFAELLKGLDIGGSKFIETEFFAENGTDALEHKHLFWNLGNRKDTLAVSDCRDIFRIKGPAGRIVLETYATNEFVQDDDLAATAQALTGADFWVESKFSDTVFFSERFEKIISDHGLRDLFELKSVRIL